MRNIINEEIQKFLNESRSYEGDEFKFRTKINNASFYGYEGFSSDYDIEIYESNINISWHLGFWLNDMGVENLSIHVDSVDGTFTLEMRDKHSDEVVQETLKNINETKWIFEIENGSINKGHSLYPQSISFDFKSKKCEVDFGVRESY